MNGAPALCAGRAPSSNLRCATQLLITAKGGAAHRTLFQPLRTGLGSRLLFFFRFRSSFFDFSGFSFLAHRAHVAPVGPHVSRPCALPQCHPQYSISNAASFLEPASPPRLSGRARRPADRTEGLGTLRRAGGLCHAHPLVLGSAKV